MAGINDTDIRLDDDWQLPQASTGDAPACSGVDCFLQDIRLEEITVLDYVRYAAKFLMLSQQEFIWRCE